MLNQAADALPEQAGELAPRVPPMQTVSAWLPPVLLAAGCYAGAELGLLLTPAGFPHGSAWLPAGLLAAALLLTPSRRWPALALAALAGALAFGGRTGLPPAATFGFFAGGLLQAMLGTWLARRCASGHPASASIRRHLCTFGCTTVVGTLPGSAVIAATAAAHGLEIPFHLAWPLDWLGLSLTALLAVPFALAWSSAAAGAAPKFPPGRQVEAAVLAVVTAGAAGWLVAAGPGPRAAHLTPLLLPLVFAGLRFGLRGATAANLALALWLAGLAAWFAPGAASASEQAALLGFLAVAVLASLAPALALEERNRTLARLQESEERYRNLTGAAFEGVLVVEDGRIADANDQLLALTGHTRAELLGRPAVSLVAPEALDAVRAAAEADADAVRAVPLLHRDGRRLETEVRARTAACGDRPVRLVAVRDVSAHRRLQRALAEGEQRLRGILDQLPTAAYTCDAAGRITYFNLQAVQLWGRAPELGSATDRFCGSLRLFTPEGAPLPHDRCWMAVALAERRPVTGRRIVIERPDGSRRTALAHASPLFDAAGGLAGAVNVLTDLSELTRARAELAASEDRFRAALQFSPIGMALITPEGAILEVNPAFCRLTGLSREELLAADFRRLLHPDDVAAGEGLMRDLLARRLDHYQREARGRHRDGRTVWVQINVSLVVAPDGTPRHFVAQVQDVTGRREAEQALRDSQGRLVLALEMARLGQWEYDVDTGWFTFDDNFLRLLGTSAAREGGRRMRADDYARRFIPPGEAGVVAAEIERAVGATDPHYTRQIEHRFRRADGSAGVMTVRLAIVKDAAGRTVRTYGVNQDITERRAAEERQQLLEAQLLQAQKMEAIGTLAGGIAHDFNNLLTGIMGNLELAGQDLGGAHPASGAVQEAHQASRRARDLVARILAFSRRGRNVRTAQPLAPVVHEALQLLRASLPSTIDIRAAVAAGVPPVSCDPGQIHQAIMNLGTNAAHAMREHGGTLTVALEAVDPDPALRARHPQVLPGHRVRLAVRDTGCGMTEAVRRRIFEPFFTTKRAGEGTGLGLSMVHGIVEDHGGAIVVGSEPGRGTTFELYFSDAAAPAGAAAPGRPADRLRPFGRRRAVLVVDDEESVLRVATLMLERLGFEPAAFADPAAALAALRAAPHGFAAAISDLTMPSMTGLEFARQARAVRPGLPLLLASGNLHGEAWADAGALGLEHLLDKPYELPALAGALRTALGEPAAGFVADAPVDAIAS